MIKHITLKTAIAAILSLTVTAVYADVPNTFTAGQPASAADVNANFTDLDGRVGGLDGRVGALEAAAVNPTNVAIDCGADANALKDAAIKADTTYNITGACTGPIYVEKDNVHLLGTSNTADSIVLPSGLDESAVFAGGANNLQISNLFLDLTATTTANQTAGIWARNSFVQVNDSRIEGGGTGINPFRGAIVRLNGTNSITEFANAGLSANDQSNINTRGQTTVTSTRVDGDYMNGISASRGSSVDIRAGITISVPTDKNAIQAAPSASILIRNSGTVSITGDIRNYRNSSIKIQKGTITGEVDIRYSSSLRLDNAVTIIGDARADESSSWIMYGGSITGDVDVRGSSSVRMQNIAITGEADVRGTSNLTVYTGSISGTIRADRGSVINVDDFTQTSNANHAVSLSSNSTLQAENSNLGNFHVNRNSTINLYSDGGTSTFKGGEMHLGSVGTIHNASSTADISVFQPGGIHLTGSSNLNGNNLYLCGTSSYVEVSVTGVGNSGATSNCRP